MIWIAAALLTASVASAYLAIRRGFFAGYALHELSDTPRPSVMHRLKAHLADKACTDAFGLAGTAVGAAVLGGWIVGRFL